MLKEEDDHLAVFGGPNRGSRMVIVGIGGGGCNAAARMSAEWSDGPLVAGVNTDGQALAACGVPVKVQIGKGITQGLGAGGDPAVGKLAAEDDGDSLRELVSQADIVILVAALGGGTGTGAAPILARIAREQGAMTLCFVTLPFEFEGELRKRQAEDGLRALRMQADVIITLPNQRLLELVDIQTGLADAFGKTDAMLGAGIRSLWKLLSKAGIINLDFADLRHLVEHSGGSCSFGYGEGEGDAKTMTAISELMNSPLLDRGRVLSQSGALMVSISGGPDLTLVEVQKIMSQITASARPGGKIFMGATVDESWLNRIVLTVLAAEGGSEEVGAETRSMGGVEEKDEPTLDDKAGGKPAAGAARTRTIQPSLNFDTSDKGRFKNVEPTIYGGEDLDIPTFVRRGIKLSFEK
jgi:cell division protein FtsZ